MRTLFLGVMLILLLGQVGCVKNGGQAQDQLLEHKIQCAEQGREFWKANRDFYTGADPSTLHTEWFAYSPRLNTCILYEDQHPKDEGEIQYFVDTLTGRNIVPVSITAKGQVDGEALKTWHELFSEANVDVDGRLDAVKKSR